MIEVPAAGLAIAWGGHFLAGACDAIAGGGGMIGLPALFVAGLPPHLALGTNKFSSTVGTLVSTWQLRRAVPLNGRLLWMAIPIAMGGSWMGAHTVLSLQPDQVELLIMGTIPLVMGLMWSSRSILRGKATTPLSPPTAPPSPQGPATISGIAGLYDGAIGPGVGTFLMLGLHRWCGVSLMSASLHTKCINLSTNIMALCVMLSAGKVMWGVAIGCAIANASGAWVGTQLTVRLGETIIRRVLPWVMGGVVVTLVMRLVLA